MVKPPYRVKNMMPGMIMLWHGAVGNIPSGWHLCDGTVGTPDLRNKFVPCAGGAYNPGDNGGADAQTHPFTGDGHFHIIPADGGIQAGDGKLYYTLPSPAVGTTDAADNRPQYYALCYIMKL